MKLSTGSATLSPWKVFGLTSVAVFLVSLDATVVLAAFPAMRASFSGASPALLSWIINAYTIVYATLLVPAGQLADRYGRKSLFSIGLTIFTVASLLCGMSVWTWLLISMRALQAVGAALLTPASLALILQAFPVSKRAIAVSLWSAIGALAAAFGPAVGAALIQWASWPLVFFINVPIGLWALWRCRFGLVESTATSRAEPIDMVGVGLLMASITTLVFGIVRAEALGVKSAVLICMLGLVILTTYVIRARRRPIIGAEIRLFADRNFRSANAATLVFGVAFTMMFLGFFLFLTSVWHYNIARAGLAVTIGPLAVMPMALLAGRLAARVGHRPLILVGGALYALSNLWLSTGLGVEPNFFGIWLPSLLLGGVSVGLILPSLTGAALAGLSVENFGVGNAVNAAIRQIGSALGAAFAVLIAGRDGAGLGQFHYLFGMLAICGIVTALLSMPIDTRRRT